ncbi:MAG: PAS domain-containing protein [Anaerolineales bacterium]|nr:PAS domain-containing protein [Anaerolineales bacterium]
MSPFFTLISSFPYIELPQGLIGWVGFIALLGVIFLLLWKWRHLNAPRERRQIALLVVLLIAAIPTSLFIGLRLPAGSALPPPGLPQNPLNPAVMVFLAIPWVLAAGMLGPTSAALVAFLSGLMLALWETHSLFTPFELALLSILFSAAVRQRFRTTAFRFLRHPLGATFLLVLLFPLIHLPITLVASSGLLVTRLDYALSNLGNVTLAIAIELLIAGLFAEVISLLLPSSWGEFPPLAPSPAEKSLQTRFIVNMAPLAIVLMLALMIGNWYVAGEAARGMLEARMANAAEIAAENIPYFLETGQNLISRLATDPRLLSDDPMELRQTLDEDIKKVPFFTQLAVVDRSKNALASYPNNYLVGDKAPVEELMGLDLAFGGVPFQTFTIPPAPDQTTAQVSFITTISNENGQVERVLVGRSDLASNPFTRPLLNSLADLTGIDGQGLLLDENKRILVHPDPSMVMTTYVERTAEEPLFYDGTALNGTRQLVYYYPAKGRAWSVVLMVPAHRAQQLALTIAAPLLGMIILLSAVAIVVMRLGLNVVTASLQTLATEAGHLAEGMLDRPLPMEGEDEVGQLRYAFEQMRASLKARLDELNRLLLVSQGVASSLEMSEAVQPVLESVLLTGASSARVVLTPAVVPELDGDASTPICFGLGPTQELYKELDEQVLALTRQQERLVLSNISRPRLLNFAPDVPRPASLMAIALRHENLYYGTLWVAYDETHNFSEEEVRFLVTLAGQAALAAANARLFQTAEIGRQRLAAILASSPDPVLVTDQSNRLLLANPAAWQVLGMGMDTDEGLPIDQVISQPDLLDLLQTSSQEQKTSEIVLPDRRVYLASATSVLAEGQRVGRVCVLRDVTHFKELDALKSEFVSTVSHDLRSPLTLMRGYATMLEMVGQLNEQQTNYVRKIVIGVESMSRLVNNLLDLGRIEAGIGLQLEMIPVHDVIERVVGALQLQASQKRVQLTTEIPKETIPLIQADQALLQQALHNLIENAIKYTKPGGKVHIRVQAQPIGMVFAVIDNGIGISPVDQPRLFEKFYRGAQQAKDQHGTGLGLAIVKSIAERHGGRVWAESQLGKGSTFYLAIPIRQPNRERA